MSCSCAVHGRKLWHFYSCSVHRPDEVCFWCWSTVVSCKLFNCFDISNAFVMSRCEKIIDHLADWTDSLKRWIYQLQWLIMTVGNLEGVIWYTEHLFTNICHSCTRGTWMMWYLPSQANNTFLLLEGRSWSWEWCCNVYWIIHLLSYDWSGALEIDRQAMTEKWNRELADK
jgi:hypothetical protein